MHGGAMSGLLELQEAHTCGEQQKSTALVS